METIIVLFLSCIGSFFGRIDFFELYFIISLSIELCNKWEEHVNDNHVF